MMCWEILSGGYWVREFLSVCLTPFNPPPIRVPAGAIAFHDIPISVLPFVIKYHAPS